MRDKLIYWRVRLFLLILAITVVGSFEMWVLITHGSGFCNEMCREHGGSLDMALGQTEGLPMC